MPSVALLFYARQALAPTDDQLTRSPTADASSPAGSPTNQNEGGPCERRLMRHRPCDPSLWLASYEGAQAYTDAARQSSGHTNP
ncbi:hypothetical protein AAHC03_04821 [Spirometra sp. Aus1]